MSEPAASVVTLPDVKLGILTAASLTATGATRDFPATSVPRADAGAPRGDRIEDFTSDVHIGRTSAASNMKRVIRAGK